MKQILVLGAGQSTTYLIDYLLKEAPKEDWFVTVGDRDLNAAQKAVGEYASGSAIPFDINDSTLRATQFQKADIVVNLLSPLFQHLIALECINYGKPMVSASYAQPRVKELDLDANRKGIIILNEMGLDPGIDHMSAMALIHSLYKQGGVITTFLSYGAGLPAPEVNSNPLRYCVTWNPRNVVRAGEAGAQYMEDGKIKVLPYHNLFNRTWTVDAEGVGTLEAYPNRDSLIYREIFGLDDVSTMIRGTLRYPGWSETWQQLVKLGLTNETMPIPNLQKMTYREFTQLFLPLHISGSKLTN
nr:saccharopine dehydrogenase [Fodinibius sp.]NIV15376.1 saccharopine dehydrogenase [Fodinibius sp.]NIY29236.1 saccharopine dehydrogenase [Fodinibius sp.]